MNKEFLVSKVDDFIAFETENEKSKNSLVHYRQVVELFVNSFDVDDICKLDVIGFKRKLEEEYAPATVKNYITIANRFIKYCELVEKDLDPDELLRTHHSKMTLKNIKIQQAASLDDVIEPSDFKRMCRMAKQCNRMDIYLIMKIFAYTGIRVSELSYFTVENVKANYITVKNKGKIRDVILRNDLKREILKYCRAEKIKSGKIFFLTYKQIYYQLKKIAGKCRGISLDKIHPHAFRHMFAINYLDAGGQVTDLMDILGHNSIQTTSLYTRTTNKAKKNMLESMKYKQEDKVMSKNYSNEDKYQEYDEIEKVYNLHFIRFYEDEIIAVILTDIDDSSLWVSYRLEDVYGSFVDSLDAETIEEAKVEVEEKIIDIVQDQVEYLQSWIHKFKSTDENENHE